MPRPHVHEIHSNQLCIHTCPYFYQKCLSKCLLITRPLFERSGTFWIARLSWWIESKLSPTVHAPTCNYLLFEIKFLVEVFPGLFPLVHTIQILKDSTETTFLPIFQKITPRPTLECSGYRRCRCRFESQAIPNCTYSYMKPTLC